PRADPRARQARPPLAGRAALLHALRQRALAVGPSLARARPPARVGDRHPAAEAARGRRGGARVRRALGRRAARQGPRPRRPLARRIARGLAPPPRAAPRLTRRTTAGAVLA